MGTSYGNTNSHKQQIMYYHEIKSQELDNFHVARLSLYALPYIRTKNYIH